MKLIPDKNALMMRESFTVICVVKSTHFSIFQISTPGADVIKKLPIA